MVIENIFIFWKTPEDSLVLHRILLSMCSANFLIFVLEKKNGFYNIMPKFMICLGMLEVWNLCLRNMSEFGKRRTDSRSVLLTLFHNGCLTFRDC